MRFIIATVLASAFLVAAAPYLTENVIRVPLSKRSNFNLVDEHGVVDIAALNTHISQTVARIDRGYANYEKNTGVPHPNVKNPQKRGAVALTDHQSDQWHGVFGLQSDYWQGTITVGTPAVDYNVTFDTINGDLYLPGPDCGSTCSGHNIYDPSISTTSRNLGVTLGLIYNDGTSFTIEQYTDTVQIAGFTATTQTLGQYSSGFSGNRFRPDGSIGLAFQKMSYSNTSPVFETIMYEEAVDSSVLAIKLAPSGPEIYIGGTDSSHYTGPITYTPVTNEGYWQFRVDNIFGNGNHALDDVSSIVDISNRFILGDSDSVDQLYQAISSATSLTVGALDGGYYTFPCDSVPTVNFTIGGTVFPIPTSALNIGLLSEGSTNCIGGIVAVPGLPAWVIGDIFLANVYTVLDYGHPKVGYGYPRVGFATLA